MSQLNYIELKTLCTHYDIEMTFFEELSDQGLIEFVQIEKSICIQEEKVNLLEKMIRLNQDLDINLAGIDTIINLLEKVENLQDELRMTKSRLDFYEGT